jgi:hypothetical protein
LSRVQLEHKVHQRSQCGRALRSGRTRSA